MKVYGQIHMETGSYANPQADEYEQWDSISDAKRDLMRMYDHPYLEGPASLLLWRGEPLGDFPCDGEADYYFELGPRGGVRPAR